MIRAVQEFFCTYGRCREVQLADGPYYPVLLSIEQIPAPGRRKMLELSYFVESRSFAGMLPGVRAYCANWLEALTARPKLRLVVDNTR